jgi:acetylornithine deacetylase/succinyl-diaminopimelate desuccinylase-like protein
MQRREFLLAAGSAASGLAQGQRSAIHQYIDDNIHTHVERIREYTRQPSISAENRGVKECAELTREYLQRAGCNEAVIVPTSGHPGVWGWLDAGAAKTLVIYWMYDVQPVNESEWQSPPFEARIVEDKRFGSGGKILRARGATNQKGPERSFLNAVESVRAAGKMPVNLMFVCEGEEELGSPHLNEIVAKYQDRLSKADGVLFPSNGQTAKGQVSLSLGNKGICYLELETNGAGSGGPKNGEIHGSLKAVADSPAWRLVQALATMTDSSGNGIQIEGVMSSVRRPSAKELDVFETFMPDFDSTVLQQQLGVDRFVNHADKRETLRRMWFEPTLNIDGIWSGYSGPGTKTILPHKANAKIDLRLVPDQSAADVASLVRKHLDRHGFADVKVNWWRVMTGRRRIPAARWCPWCGGRPGHSAWTRASI